MDLRIPENRLIILKDIKSSENQDRKDESFIASEVYNSRLRQYVFEYLRGQFSDTTVKEMPVISSCNLSRRICKEIATIYKESPERFFTELSEEQSEVVQKIYKDAKADFLLSKANEFYILQNQCLLQIFPQGGKINFRVLKMHHFDVIPDPVNPEKMLGVVINAYNKDFKREEFASDEPRGRSDISRQNLTSMSDNVNQSIADEDDAQAHKKRFVVWTKRYTDESGEDVPALNFIMDGKGNVLSEDPYSPIDDLPFIDISSYKDFQFYVSETNTVTDFTIQYNALLSDLAHTTRMQAWSQAYLKASKDLMPNNIQVGPTKIIHLPIDPDASVDTEFGFASPNSDIKGGIEFAEFLLRNFLTSKGLDPKVISGSAEASRFNSGIERLLSMIERFEASKEDYALFGSEIEAKVYELIKTWHNTLKGTDQLDFEYQTADLPEDSKVTTDFVKPEAIQTKNEKVTYHQELLELGLGSRVTAIMDINDMSREEAEEYLTKLDEDEGLSNADKESEDVIQVEPGRRYEGDQTREEEES